MNNKKIIIGFLAATCFLPAGVISIYNRPKDFMDLAKTAVTSKIIAVDLPTSIMDGKDSVIELPPITIKATKSRPQVNTAPSSKPVYCRDVELLSGGTVRHCDTEPPVIPNK